MTNITDELLAQLKREGCRGITVAIEHLCDLRAEIEGLYARGLLDESFYRERLAWFDFNPPEDLPARTLIIVAVPRGQSQAIFHWNGTPRQLILPPTYVGYERTNQRVEHCLARILEPSGYRVARTALPLKLLATHSGLGAYGRNNICYVPGMGSFLQLVAVYSDLPCTQDHWDRVQMMERCQNCIACLHHCPTGAICSDRFLLRAERCLVFHNERPGHIPFPVWMDPKWHNCLEGCMRCQNICPEDKTLLSWVEEQQEFSEEETRLLLHGVSNDQLPAAIAQKLEQLDLIPDLPLLPRNLGVFFEGAGA